MMPKPVVLATIILCSILGAVAQLLLKRGVSPLSIQKIALGLSFYVLAMGLYLICLRYVPLRVGYPLIAMSYIWVMVLSHLFLHEKASYLNVLGSAAIVVGVGLTMWG